MTAVGRLKPFEAINPRKIRTRLGLNQQKFWTRVGVTQTGGSRYECGRRMPKPVQELLRLVYIERLDLSRVRKEDFEIVERLKSDHRELYQSLRRTVKGEGK
jgi:transcriptional regulator with XRE-family HTH domain